MGRKDKTISSEALASQELGAKMRLARQEKAISLTDMARKVGYSKSLLSSVENGRVPPTQQLLEEYERVLELESGSLTRFVGSEPTPKSRRRYTPSTDIPQHISAYAINRQMDLREAPAIKHFYGRDKEIGYLKQWLLKDRCKLVGIFGIGGIGKTTLAARLVDQVKTDFEFVFWGSLQNAPSIENILKRAILLFSEGQQNESDLAEEEDAMLSTLIELLIEHRCLMILDNFEAVLQGNNPVGQYKDEYLGYSKLIQRVGEGNHQSCLILTSREKPGEILRLEGRTQPVRSMEVLGIEQLEAIENILKGEGLTGTTTTWQDFVKRYGGNPLALKLISSYIREIFVGDIASFLNEGQAALGDVSDLIEQQFMRLSPHEQNIMYWLAIQCEPVSLETLAQDVLPSMSRIDLLAAISSLRKRFMIEIPRAKNFVLQPVITEYLINKFVTRICEEIMSGDLDIFATHALINAQAWDYIRRDQERQILQPIVERLLSVLGRDGTEQKLTALLTMLRQQRALKPEYSAGNILNLLVALNNGRLDGYNFSHLAIKKAYLQGTTLHNVNFAYADIQTSLFTETFKGVTCVALNPDGKLLAAGTETGTIRLRDVTTGELKLTLRSGDASWVCWSVAFSPDGKMLASGSEDKLIRLWDTGTGDLLKTLAGHSNWVRTVAFSPDGGILASSSYDQTIRLWDVASGECLMVLDEHNGPVHSVAFNHNGTVLASGSDDHTIRLWDVGNRQSSKVLTGGDSHVFAVSFSPDGSILASAGGDRCIYLWDSETGEQLMLLKGHADQIFSLAFSSDGSILASSSDDQTVRIWDVQTGESLRVLRHNDSIWPIAFSAQDDMLVSGSLDYTIRFWDIYQGNCLRELQGYSNAIRSVSFSPDGQLLASCGENRALRLWRLMHGQEPILDKTLEGHTSAIRFISFSPDGKLLASGGEDKTIRLWSVEKGISVRVLKGHSTWVKSVAFSPDGKLLASGSIGQTIRLWDVDTGSHIKKLSAHEGQVRSVAFSPDGRLLASASDDQTVRLWEASPDGYVPAKILRGHEGHVWAVVFSPDGKLLASCSDDKTIRLWEVGTGRQIKVLEAKDSVWIGSLAFSPDGDILVSGHGDWTVRLWDVGSGEVIRILRGHSNVIYTVAFSPDGQMLASGGRDGVIKLWDVQTSKNLATIYDKRPYELMNIVQASGLNEAQREMLKALGAVEEEEEVS
jgi:WD40 repeat protein/transcriptional regulator with XRE-family HTH domain